MLLAAKGLREGCGRGRVEAGCCGSRYSPAPFSFYFTINGKLGSYAIYDSNPTRSKHFSQPSSFSADPPALSDAYLLLSKKLPCIWITPEMV